MTIAFVAVAFVVGLAAISVGAALIFLPAGLIVGGVLLAGCAALYVRGMAVERPEPQESPRP